MKIEDAWASLAASGPVAAQTRVSASHPHDLYADYEPPGQVGLVAVCASRPPALRPLRTLSVEEGRRKDGRWTLRLQLVEPLLRPVFAALCDDIIAFTLSGVPPGSLASAVVKRLLHWRSLLERDGSGLDEAILRGLIGELTVLRERVLPVLPALDAVRSWTGPYGTPQDFQLPTGRRLEVKAVTRNADRVRINGLSQLDAGADPLTLVVVRLDPTGAGAPGAVTAPALVAATRDLLADEPEALAMLDRCLAGVGWHEHPAHGALVVRVVSVEEHEVDSTFPRLTVAKVPAGIMDADYVVALPGTAAEAAS